MKRIHGRLSCAPIQMNYLFDSVCTLMCWTLNKQRPIFLIFYIILRINIFLFLLIASLEVRSCVQKLSSGAVKSLSFIKCVDYGAMDYASSEVAR